MSSLLTNNSAMVALQTLKTINKNLAKTQDAISTGQNIATARDNAAIWGISTTMKSDVSGFKAISESLSLGSATLSVARDGAETIAGLLDQLKGKVVAAQEDNVDRTKIQADVDALRNQIKTVVDAAQFNGLNLLKRQVPTNGVAVLASLNRASDGTVTASSISFQRRTLEAATVAAPAAVAAATPTNVITVGAADTDLASASYVVGDLISLELTTATGGGQTFAYSVTEADVATGKTIGALSLAVADAFRKQAAASGALGTTVTFTPAALDTNDAAIGITTGAAVSYQSAKSGGLSALDMVDVSSVAYARAALSAMEPMIQNAINAAAAFGSAQGRIQTQDEYLGKIIDGLTSGVGALVDADMEEASAKLQALQVQQQLGIQALTIANQSPQNILALFQR